MSDIPIGSPPVPPGRHAAPGGWYPDPLDARRERYWDGWQWTRNLRDVETPAYPQQYPQQQYPQQQYPQQQYPQQQYPLQQYPLQQYQQPYPQQPHPQQQVPQPYGNNPYAPQHAYPPVPSGVLFTADGVRVSGWWWRVLATLLDGLITGVLGGIIAAPLWIRFWQRFSVYFNETLDAANSGQPPPAQPVITDFLPYADQAIITAIGALVVFAYSVVFLRWKGATPGQLICGLRVVPVDQGRFSGHLDWSVILIRVSVWVVPLLLQLIPVLSFVTLLIRGADALWPLWQPKKQSLHDLAAKTQVVKIS